MRYLLLFRVDERRLAVPLEVVERVVRAVEVTLLPNAPDDVLGVINLQGRIVPVMNTRRLVGAWEREVSVHDHFIIVNLPSLTIAVPADQGTLVMQCDGEDVVTAEDAFAQPLEGVEGVLKQDGEMIVIYDLETFLSPHIGRSLGEALAG